MEPGTGRSLQWVAPRRSTRFRSNNYFKERCWADGEPLILPGHHGRMVTDPAAASELAVFRTLF